VDLPWLNGSETIGEHKRITVVSSRPRKEQAMRLLVTLAGLFTLAVLVLPHP
jgi:hypothetical protein